MEPQWCYVAWAAGAIAAKADPERAADSFIPEKFPFSVTAKGSLCTEQLAGAVDTHEQIKHRLAEAPRHQR